jgi:predicted ribosome quality control (RQC) complex YloA/Tae2 family protein
MMPEREALQQEIARLQGLLAAQEQRIAALEHEAEAFRQIEAQLLQAISRANAGFRAMVRTARAETPS